jgi:hypothetical protein
MIARALLKGQGFDLDALADLFATGDPRVIQAGDETFLEATVLDEPFTAKDGGRLVEFAEGILARMNGTAKLRDAGYRTVTLANQFHRDNHQHVMVYDEACIRDSISVARAGVAQGQVRMSATVTAHATGVPAATPVPEGPRQLARAAAHSDADDLLVLIGSADTLGWDTLWKAMEIVRTAVGGKAALIATGWVTTAAFDEFGYAANEPQASGDDARHARRPPKTPPARIMTIEEGRQFIRDLARHWLDSLP